MVKAAIKLKILIYKSEYCQNILYALFLQLPIISLNFYSLLCINSISNKLFRKMDPSIILSLSNLF